MITKLLRSRHPESPDHNRSRPVATHTRGSSPFRPRGCAAPPNDTLTVSVAEEVYLQRLRGLGAWWLLGSSAVEPLFLVHYAPVEGSVHRLVATVDGSGGEALRGMAAARDASD